MGATNSKVEEDKALQLCRERKKFVWQALNGRFSLAEAHFVYIEALKATGSALRKFLEPQAPTNFPSFNSTTATPEPLALTGKSLSQFSFSSPSLSQRVDATENISPSPSPPSHVYRTNAMKFRGTSSSKIEQKASVPVTGSVTSSTAQNTSTPTTQRPETSPFEASPVSAGPLPWDYFGLFRPVDEHFSSEEGKDLNEAVESLDDIKRLREVEGIPDLEDEERLSSNGKEELQESEDDFDEPSTPMLVRSFENVTRATDHSNATASPTTPSAENLTPEIDNLSEKINTSPSLTRLRDTHNGVALPNDEKTTLTKQDGFESKVAPKDFFSSMKDVEDLFLKASDSGREVRRMLEANEFNFCPVFPRKERGSMASTLFKTCFSCGEDPSQGQEGEPPHTSAKYLTWHRTTSFRSSSSRYPLGVNLKDETEDFNSNLFGSFCMVSGSHASTLDRLFAWEKKLYDEVKAGEMIRKEYDQKCKLLRQQESNDESFHRIDKTRAVIKDLHSRLRVAIHRIDRISKNIEVLRDTELQPQLEELIDGLRKMWEVMLECHRLQVHIIAIAHNNDNIKISIQSDLHHQIAIHLERELNSLSSRFTKWIDAQVAYIDSINKWLYKCVLLTQKSSKRKRRDPPTSLKKFGPPIYTTCDVWLEKLKGLPTRAVADSMKGLAAEIGHFLPQQEKKQVKGVNNDEARVNMLREEASEWTTGFDNFHVRLLRFFDQLNNYADASVKMIIELQEAIQEAKNNYAQLNSQS